MMLLGTGLREGPLTLRREGEEEEAASQLLCHSKIYEMECLDVDNIPLGCSEHMNIAHSWRQESQFPQINSP